MNIFISIVFRDEYKYLTELYNDNDNNIHINSTDMINVFNQINEIISKNKFKSMTIYCIANIFNEDEQIFYHNTDKQLYSIEDIINKIVSVCVNQNDEYVKLISI